jgi:hypothetical protein
MKMDEKKVKALVEGVVRQYPIQSFVGRPDGDSGTAPKLDVLTAAANRVLRQSLGVRYNVWLYGPEEMLRRGQVRVRVIEAIDPRDPMRGDVYEWTIGAGGSAPPSGGRGLGVGGLLG